MGTGTGASFLKKMTHPYLSPMRHSMISEMVENELLTNGMILATYPQGEYGKRISLLCDRYGKITVFSKGTAKQTSKSIGAVRPMVSGSFTLVEGKNAKTLCSVQVLDSFEEIPLDPDLCFYGMYVMEFAEYMAQEGMPEPDCKRMLNLIFLTLKALREKKLPPVLIRRIFELRMLVHEGTYTEKPFFEDEDSVCMWKLVLTAPLSSLFQEKLWKKEDVAYISEMGEDMFPNFTHSVQYLLDTQLNHKFMAAQLL